MAKRNSTLIPSAAYARRSTDLQDRSIPDQKAYIEKWAAEHGYRIMRWYVDDAISGTSSRGRDDFARMIDTAENGRDFESILCYDISRFSRGGTNETGYYLHRLKMAGVEVLFPADAIPEGDEGELIQGVKSWQARQYSVKLARDVIRGSISNIVERHSAPGGLPPFGYDKQHQTASGQVLRTLRWLPDGRKQEFSPEGKLVRVLDPAETIKKAKSDIIRYVPSAPDRVATIQRIFAQCCEGYGYQYIAARLNEDGISSQTGGKWNKNQVKNIIAHPVYRGAVVWNKRTVGKIHGVDGEGNLRTKQANSNGINAKEDWFMVEGVHEALVTPEVFEKAQAAVLSRRSAGGQARPTNRSLLSGLIICRNCGHRFHRRRVNATSGGITQRYYYYNDGGYSRGGRSVCVQTNIPLDAMDAFVIARVRDALLGEHKTVKKAVDAFVARVTAGRTKKDDAGLRRDLDALNRRIKATIAMLADPSFDGLDELKTTLADLKTRRDALQGRIKAAPTSAALLKESDLRKWANERIGQLDHLTDCRNATVEARNLIHACVDRIEIFPHEKRGVLYLPADLYACFNRDVSRRVTHGDHRGALKMKGEA